MTFTIAVYSAELLMMNKDTVQNTEFYSKNKFEKLLHLVGFIIRINMDVSEKPPTFIFRVPRRCKAVGSSEMTVINQTPQ